MNNTTINPVLESLVCLSGVIAAGLCMGNAIRLMMHYGAPCRLLLSTTELRILQAIILGFWLSLPLVLMGIVLSLTDGAPWLMACGLGWLMFFLPVTVVKQSQFLNNRYSVYREANQLIF